MKSAGGGREAYGPLASIGEVKHWRVPLMIRPAVFAACTLTCLRPSWSDALMIPGSQPIVPPVFQPKPEPEPEAQTDAVLFERVLNIGQRQVDLTPQLRDALVRIEGIYDKTRIDDNGLQLTTRPHVSAGTASMNNVFADRWRLRSTDPSVSLRVRYIAQAWNHDAEAPCSAFEKRRPGVRIVEVTAMSSADCAKLRQSQEQAPGPLDVVSIADAPAPIPIFASPEPGNRMSIDALRAALQVRTEAVRQRLTFQRLGLENRNKSSRQAEAGGN